MINSHKSTFNNFEERLSNALRAKEISERQKIDTLEVKSYISLSSIYRDNGNVNLFLKYSHKGLKLASKINETSLLAQINKSLGYYYYDVMVDSAYYYNNKAEKLFRGLKDKFNTAVVLLDISILQRIDKDYTGSELTSVEGLSLLDQLDETEGVKKYKSYFYNNLGIVFKELSQWEESIKYNNRALDIKKQLQGNNKATIDNQKNNIANVYKNSKDYDLALEYYNELLSRKNLINDRPDFYAMVLDNYAHTLYLSKNLEQLPGLYLKALSVSDTIDDVYNNIILNLHLAEYYNDLNKKDSAKYYAYKAKGISKEFSKDTYLESLLVLSKIEKDSIAVKYYDAYIELNDSLIKNERSIRNKFTRIQYETDKIEEENIQIAKERMWLLIISVVVILASFLLYLVVTQRNKNKELQFIQKQQETNEEIYNLMLSQNESIEEARTQEKKRISEELHDGVLGRLFGTRLSLDSLNMGTTADAIKTRGEYIVELKTIEEDIRKVSHELNTDFVSGSGFIDIIKTLVETQTLAYGLHYNFEHDGTINWDGVSNKKKIHIYRIIQESLHNIYKHANATQVSISFKLKNNVICLIMTDNGSGFDVNKAKSGIGLKNMNSRIKEINGIINITSEKNIGTKVTIEVPIP
ncbi:hypothetical protein GCM10023314_10630 [Algibacter agarivorans]|uniref:histidine kinase n=1 Tax=Algibacter agarivorans TaxID=1109741 RepID=A0ABP9GDZ9_9FLAO